ncbi:hypothetical protein DKX38_030081 (mitochondrion) [Salix brachista]|uniref:Uncharacterized protein n=1 Tax=Salix brachista TaxID=2182728 RepID=A0A5N5IXY4_9ROSI|nr:hypothetical protein DKX38_030081 [Salix brachista]
MDIAGRLATIQQEIGQVENEKLQREQMLGLFWEHMPAIDPSLIRGSYAGYTESNPSPRKPKEGPPSRTAGASSTSLDASLVQGHKELSSLDVSRLSEEEEKLENGKTLKRRSNEQMTTELPSVFSSFGFTATYTGPTSLESNLASRKFEQAGESNSLTGSFLSAFPENSLPFDLKTFLLAAGSSYSLSPPLPTLSSSMDLRMASSEFTRLNGQFSSDSIVFQECHAGYFSGLLLRNAFLELLSGPLPFYGYGWLLTSSQEVRPESDSSFNEMMSKLSMIPGRTTF